MLVLLGTVWGALAYVLRKLTMTLTRHYSLNFISHLPYRESITILKAQFLVKCR